MTLQALFRALPNLRRCWATDLVLVQSALLWTTKLMLCCAVRMQKYAGRVIRASSTMHVRRPPLAVSPLSRPIGLASGLASNLQAIHLQATGEGYHHSIAGRQAPGAVGACVVDHNKPSSRRV